MGTHHWIPAVASAATHLLPSEAYPDPDPVLALLCKNALALASETGNHLALRPACPAPLLIELTEPSLGALLRLIDQVFRGLDRLETDPGLLKLSSPTNLGLDRSEALGHVRTIYDAARSALLERWPPARLEELAAALWALESIHACETDSVVLSPLSGPRSDPVSSDPQRHRLLSLARPLQHELWHLPTMRLLALVQLHRRIATLWTGDRLTELILLPTSLATALLDSPHATGVVLAHELFPTSLPVREFAVLGATFLLDLGAVELPLAPERLAAWRAGVLLEMEAATPFAPPDLPHAAKLHRAARAALV